MIVLRISGIQGKHCEIGGGSKIEGKFRYNQSNAGWFPISSANFGLQSRRETTATTNTGQAPGIQGQKLGNPPPRVEAARKSDSDEAFSTINVSKAVDSVSTTLMGFAMTDRKVTKADEKSVRKADIHFLDSVQGQSSAADQFVFPYLMITLQNVLVKGWSISASGDDRPSESLELWYDKAAMRYFSTRDGRVWEGGDIKGWDQHKNDVWTPSKGEAPYFAEEPR